MISSVCETPKTLPKIECVLCARCQQRKSRESAFMRSSRIAQQTAHVGGKAGGNKATYNNFHGSTELPRRCWDVEWRQRKMMPQKRFIEACMKAWVRALRKHEFNEAMRRRVYKVFSTRKLLSLLYTLLSKEHREYKKKSRPPMRTCFPFPELRIIWLVRMAPKCDHTE